MRNQRYYSYGRGEGEKSSAYYYSNNFQITLEIPVRKTTRPGLIFVVVTYLMLKKKYMFTTETWQKTKLCCSINDCKKYETCWQEKNFAGLTFSLFPLSFIFRYRWHLLVIIWWNELKCSPFRPSGEKNGLTSIISFHLVTALILFSFYFYVYFFGVCFSIPVYGTSLPVFASLFAFSFDEFVF